METTNSERANQIFQAEDNSVSERTSLFEDPSSSFNQAVITGLSPQKLKEKSPTYHKLMLSIHDIKESLNLKTYLFPINESIEDDWVTFVLLLEDV